MKTNSFYLIVMSLLIAFTMCSCNSRQARIAGKIMRNIEHASEEDDTDEENVQYEPIQDDVQLNSEVRYNISGICQRENGRIDVFSNRVAIETSDGLFLADGTGNPCDRIYKNDVQTITETHVILRSFDEDKTELRPYNVSGYAYKCYNGIVTMYFNIHR